MNRAGKGRTGVRFTLIVLENIKEVAGGLRGARFTTEKNWRWYYEKVFVRIKISDQ